MGASPDAVGSGPEPAGASPQLRRPRRSVGLTLRLRLTLLYGAVFLLAGAGLLTATYLLFKHSQPSTTSVSIPRQSLKLPANVTAEFATQQPARVSGGGTAVTTTSGGAGASGLLSNTPRYMHGGPLPKKAKPSQHLLQEVQTHANLQFAQLVGRANLVIRQQKSGDASSLLEWSAIALGVVALLSIGVAWWLAGRALRPLRTMNSRARAITAENLHERLGVEDRRDELGELATTFDALLARLEGAFDSQRRFVANASHELRTPITLERTLIEVALADPDASVESLRRVCERVVSSTEEQERLLDALLTLARSEAGVATGESVDLAAVAADALLAREARLGGISVESVLEPTVVVGDQALLERLVGNLVENAIVHNGGERWIRIFTLEGDGVPVLRIANSGQVVAADDVEQLFEPFRRGVGERLRGDAGGLGLGLSIVRAVAVAHAASIEARPLPEGGLEFELRFTSATGAKPPVGGLETVTA
ncbi:MAG: HAMP domain-containing protein [Acidobacteriota bacterium]|nr:HAMP domain-containing protein [Acidobacteriota bacterium]